MPTSWHASWVWIACLPCFPSYCFAAFVNRTIDSGNGDPVTGFQPLYKPTHAWDDQTCGGCYIQPEPALAFDGTWMATTYHPSLQNVNITLEFTGVAVWVFFILANRNNHGLGTTTNTQCNFTLDEQYAGSFSHDPDLSTYDQEYNVPVFSHTNLRNISHQLIIAANDYPISTFINFDYAIYMIELPDPLIDNPNSPPPATVTASSNTTGTTSLSAMSTSSSSTLTSSTLTQSFTISISPSSEASSTTLSSKSSSSPMTVVSKTLSTRTGLIIGSTIGGLTLIAITILACYRYRSRQITVQGESAPDRLLDIAHTGHHSSATDVFGASISHRTSQVTSVRISRQSQWSRIIKVRAMRQRQISEQIRAVQHQMDELTSSESATSTNSVADATPVESEHDIAGLRDQVQELRNVIESLRRQQDSAWALGLTDEEPPPAYSHSPTVEL